MRGLSAFETVCALQLHMMRKGYDGWTYNFRTKSALTRFNKNVQTKFAYSKIEQEYPDKISQLKFFYPFMSKNSFKINLLNIRKMTIDYNNFISYIDEIELHFRNLCSSIAKELGSLDRIFDQGDVFPVIYQLFDCKLVTIDQVVLLFLIMPDLNSTSSNEPFVYDKWKADILFNKKFLSLYISVPIQNRLKLIVVDEFNGKLNVQ